MSIKIGLGVLLALAAAAAVILKPWKKRGDIASSFGGKLRNAQGVGPAHVSGVPRAEEQARRNGAQELTSVAGRIAGSVDPQ